MRLAATAAALVAALAFVPPASAVLILQRGMAGIRLGMTQPKVRAKLGRPRSVVHGSNDFGNYIELHYRHFRITFQGNSTVTAIWTSSPRQRTRRGIGVGSTVVAIHARIRGVRCTRGHCYVGKFLPGRRVTEFFLRRGRVSAITVGFVID